MLVMADLHQHYGLMHTCSWCHTPPTCVDIGLAGRFSFKVLGRPCVHSAQLQEHVDMQSSSTQCCWVQVVAEYTVEWCFLAYRAALASGQ